MVRQLLVQLYSAKGERPSAKCTRDTHACMSVCSESSYIYERVVHPVSCTSGTSSNRSPAELAGRLLSFCMASLGFCPSERAEGEKETEQRNTVHKPLLRWAFRAYASMLARNCRPWLPELCPFQAARLPGRQTRRSAGMARSLARVGALVLPLVPAASAGRDYALVLPVYRPHFQMLHRFLTTLETHVYDKEKVDYLVVASDGVEAAEWTTAMAGHFMSLRSCCLHVTSGPVA